ncbi:hypothetical protein H9Q13_10690 [Pontibacter sp. JH31]|uniref:Lipoprotein n=1 Tax=Pontibacter aquaedesilientis TaxID=2766980 RepID=A0ABR7XH53_9BACT|nr:hypothetical protein [Pontibacter aquaedesilientis]MBD1397635.1 hypothetical protein [Pontibacter aquaedesilientis]
MKHTLCILLLLFILGSCKSVRTPAGPDFYEEDSDVNLYAFIGQKISVENLKRDTSATETFIGFNGDTVVQKVIYFDQGFTARYKVEKSVFNNLQQDTITFVAFDHYGRPEFENYEFVMLYLSKYEKDNRFYHQKYQYDPVIKNEKGVWSGLNGENIAELFQKKKSEVFKALGLFD